MNNIIKKIFKYGTSLAVIILFFIIFFGNANAALIQNEEICKPGIDECNPGMKCMPWECEDRVMLYKCFLPTATYQINGVNMTREQFKYNAAEIAMCEQGQDYKAAWNTRMAGLGGQTCSSSSDCPSEQPNCFAMECKWDKKEVVYACTNKTEPNLKPADEAKCKAGTLERQLKLEGECAAKAPKDRGIFTKGLSDLCVGCGICSQKDVFQIIVNIFTFILQISGSLAVLILVVGGIMYMTAAGDQQKTGQAKAALTAAIVGIIIVLTSFLLISFVMSLLGYTNAGSWFSPSLK